MASMRDQMSRRKGKDSQFEELLNQQGQILNLLAGEEFGGFGTGGISGNPSRLGRKSISEILSGREDFRKSLPDYYSSLARDVEFGGLSPSEAAAAYESAARGAGVFEGTYEKAGNLRRMPAGASSVESYQRYNPFFQLSAQQTLGRTLSEPEIQNYVNAFRGLGLSSRDPGAVSAAFGKMLTTSDEFQDRQYRFKPEMPKMNQDSEAFAKMLNASFS